MVSRVRSLPKCVYMYVCPFFRMQPPYVMGYLEHNNVWWSLSYLPQLYQQPKVLVPFPFEWTYLGTTHVKWLELISIHLFNASINMNL